MVGYELLSFGAQGQVCEEDVAVFGEESTGEGEVDPLGLLLECLEGRRGIQRREACTETYLTPRLLLWRSCLQVIAP